MWADLTSRTENESCIILCAHLDISKYSKVYDLHNYAVWHTILFFLKEC